MQALVAFSVMLVSLPYLINGADTNQVVEKLHGGLSALQSANETIHQLIKEMQSAPKERLPELQKQAVTVLKELQKEISGGAGSLGEVGAGVTNAPLAALYIALKGLLDSVTGLLNEVVTSANPGNVVNLLSSVVTNLMKAAERVLKFVTSTLQGSAADLSQGVTNVIEGALAVPNNIILNFIKLLADLSNAAGGITNAKRMALVN